MTKRLKKSVVSGLVFRFSHLPFELRELMTRSAAQFPLKRQLVFEFVMQLALSTLRLAMANVAPILAAHILSFYYPSESGRSSGCRVSAESRTLDS